MKRSIDPLRYHSSRALNAVTPQPLHRALGLTDGELGRIQELLERDPNDFELAVYSLLWSEHCGYKHSKLLLRRFPSSGARVLQGPGENAGVIDVGDGLAVALKVESHNHPSAVEPFQGAATGVGGILRDIFAMGARPIAILDSLRFGELADDRQRRLFSQVVAGVGHYGNCVGVANLGGEVYFEPPYEHNCLVNAMCVGLLPAERLTSARATGVGNLLVLYGSRTGRDGIGGASVLASQGFDEASADKRPSVQIGDPFMGKKLIECTLELLDRGMLASLQDLGAAGLASSTSEMAAAGGVGLDVDLSKVPLREADMEPFEIMISESQERMAAIVERSMVESVFEACARWEVDATVIGEVTDSGTLRCLHGGRVVGEIPVETLVDGAPRYEVERTRPARLVDEPLAFAPVDDVAGGLRALLASPNIASRRWIYQQYDQLVGSGTAIRPGGDAGVVRLTPSRRAIAVSLDGNGRRTSLDPRRGGMSAVCEAARNVACTGARPAAVTNCLNFGNPETGEVGYELAEAIEGMSLACEALGLPVVSGNVSLYNEHFGSPIHPTPVVGAVGVLDDAELAVSAAFAGADDVVLLAGDGPSALDGSEYQKRVLGAVAGRIPEPDLVNERLLHEFLAQAAERRLLRSAHDVADGGLAVALAESAIMGGIGVSARCDDPFGEGDGRVVISARPEHVAVLHELAGALALQELGTVGGTEIAIGAAILPLSEAVEIFENALPAALGEAGMA
ncbi:MAG: phosphoribosylformylglycinamidine synthase subunit PurL [Gaiellales bacterium]|nr:phosphoribosylformylglycinamidine synthase subunit PurL [Gaiellales bacterium]